MGVKRDLFCSSLSLHQKVAKRLWGKRIVFTQAMAYDTVSSNMYSEYKKQVDYIRHRTIELIAEEIKKNNIEGDIAEAGVAWGDCSWIINGAFPDRKFFLYDTFSGFDKRDIEIDQNHNYTSNEFFESMHYFKNSNFKTPDEQIEYVRQRLKYPENVVFRKGYFPETATNEKDRCFAFVSLDMDLYQPILNGIEFFYPRLNKGGYMMIHDYNHKEMQGVKKAVAEAEKRFGRGVIPKVPLPDEGGTIVLMKL